MVANWWCPRCNKAVTCEELDSCEHHACGTMAIWIDPNYARAMEARLREAASKLERLDLAARHACREFSSVKAFLAGTLLGDERTLLAHIEATVRELQEALHE